MDKQKNMQYDPAMDVLFQRDKYNKMEVPQSEPEAQSSCFS